MNFATAIATGFVLALAALSVLFLFAGCPWTAVITSVTAWTLKDMVDEDEEDDDE